MMRMTRVEDHRSYQYAAEVVEGVVEAPKYVIDQAREFLAIARDEDPEFCINLKILKKMINLCM